MSNAFVGNYRKLSNEELVEKINSGDSEALRVLIFRHMPMIHRLAVQYAQTSSETEDFEQDALIAFYNAVKSFRAGQASFSTFASVCIRRALIAELRMLSRRRRIPRELISPMEELDISSDSNPEEIFVEKESLISLTDSIKLELSALEYRILRCFLSGMSYSLISERLGISYKSVDNALRRIRLKLKKKKAF